MPFWLQIAAAVSAALASGLMGAAYVPFLRRLRFCEPQSPDEKDSTAVGEKLRPTMGGVLLPFGTLFGLVLSYGLCQSYGLIDSTSLETHEEAIAALSVFLYGLFFAAVGFLQDYLLVRQRIQRKTSRLLQCVVCFLGSLVFVRIIAAQLWEDSVSEMYFGSFTLYTGMLWLPVTAAVMTVFQTASDTLREEPDGTEVTVSGILLLTLNVLLLQQSLQLPALLSLTSAGACMGCLVWCLYPAKCRIGNTGRLWLSAEVTALSFLTRQYFVILLLAAVYLINLLPLLKKNSQHPRSDLQSRMQQAGMGAGERIGILACLAAICGGAAIMLIH